jgi:hypothetical protein
MKSSCEFYLCTECISLISEIISFTSLHPITDFIEAAYPWVSHSRIRFESKERNVEYKQQFWLNDCVLVILFWYVCFRKIIFKKLFFKFFYICLSLEKLINEKHFSANGKHFPVKEKFSLVFRKVFFFYFGRKTLSESCEKFRNIILFDDYIKFDPQTFDFYIYFVLNIYFSISSLRI